ncbi:MAG TPA: hypothetical protein VME20_11980 [Acidimicrobiales bacterium]|nr:hypothetical protein [Acidimicrobiales bacterium]
MFARPLTTAPLAAALVLASMAAPLSPAPAAQANAAALSPAIDVLKLNACAMLSASEFSGATGIKHVTTTAHPAYIDSDNPSDDVGPSCTYNFSGTANMEANFHSLKVALDTENVPGFHDSICGSWCQKAPGLGIVAYYCSSFGAPPADSIAVLTKQAQFGITVEDANKNGDITSPPLSVFSALARIAIHNGL